MQTDRTQSVVIQGCTCAYNSLFAWRSWKGDGFEMPNDSKKTMTYHACNVPPPYTAVGTAACTPSL